MRLLQVLGDTFHRYIFILLAHYPASKPIRQEVFFQRITMDITLYI